METWQKGSQTIILDVAHNPAGIQALVDTLIQYHPHTSFSVLLGCSADKNHKAMQNILASLTDRIQTTAFDHPRSWHTNTGVSLDYENVEDALLSLSATAAQTILCTGSIFFVACEFYAAKACI
ncbi:MAG: cyanophycin synthetase [Bdellovibrionota bacterium]